MGSLVRLRGSGNPDKTWVQPEIIVWGYVVTAAHLSPKKKIAGDEDWVSYTDELHKKQQVG